MAGIPSIVIDQGFGALGIEMTPAQMKITTPRPEMQIVREDPKMSVEFQAPEFKLNWKKIETDIGSKVIWNKINAYKGVHISGESTAYNKNPEGAKNDIAPTIQLPRHKTIKVDNAELNLNSIPQSRPEVEWTPGTVNINWTKGALSVDWVGDYMPEVVIDPPFSIEIFLREKPYIKIMVEDGTAPEGSGIIVDKRL